MRFFGDASNNQFDYLDLVKILEDLDSKHKGTLCYNDFCKWMGGSIHKSEGFLFRHDSVKNPPFEAKLPQIKDGQDMQRRATRLTTAEVKEALAKKFEFQWKTLQSAFNHLNLGKSGKIQRWEFKYYCDHWGYTSSEEQFDEIFNTFDVDQDGEISYQDLQKAFGSILNPPENFYFRQDLKKKGMSNVCSEPDCSFVPVGYSNMCVMHNKQMRMKSMNILSAIKDKIGNQWDAFLDTLKAEAVNQLDSGKNTDGISVDFKYFTKALQAGYGIMINDGDKRTLIKTFGAKSES